MAHDKKARLRAAAARLRAARQNLFDVHRSTNAVRPIGTFPTLAPEHKCWTRAMMEYYEALGEFALAQATDGKSDSADLDVNL